MPNQQIIKERIRCKRCGGWATRGEYKDGVEDYLCKECDMTFLDDEEQTVIS